jgi:deoxyribodipyrimidine photo-lyase
MNRTIVWFRRDLRLNDHAPLARAVQRGEVIPVFIFDRALLHHPETAPARVAFMLDCLRSLDADLRQLGGRLILRSGDPVVVLPQLVRETAAEGIYAHIDFERIYGRVRDARVSQALTDQQMRIRWFEPLGGVAELIPYPQYRQCWYHEMSAAMLPTPSRVPVPTSIHSEDLPTLADLGLLADRKHIPIGGTTAARQLLATFLNEKAERYYWQLSYPSAEATSGLSPYIKFGAISIRECYQTVQQYLKGTTDMRVKRSGRQLISRLRWGSGFTQRFRYLPQLEIRSLYQVFDDDGWGFDETLYQAWQQGETGFPIVDAAARCLQATGGWQALNFRSRAIYASFLSNLLGIDWRYGALHFMRHLIDGDCPIDHYQWAMQAGVTHCADKSWTRIYNPAQAAVDRCDPEGAFIKHWVPELAHLSAAELGTPPWVKGYPTAILNYKTARKIRVQRLEQQRQQFRQQSNVVPFLAGLPDDLTPFGADRGPSETGWAKPGASDRSSHSGATLLPPPLDLTALDDQQAKALRTWFVAHVNIAPRPKRTQKKPRVEPDFLQLPLF